MTTNARPDRRAFLGRAACAAAGLSLAAADRPRSRPEPPPERPRKKLAVVTTAYHYLSHAYHLCGRFLHGYLRDGRMHYPDFAIAGMYVEQQKDNDLSRELSRRHGFSLHADVAGALTLGGKELAVDGVLLIGEHGDYPYNDRLQKLYPRHAMFQKILTVFRAAGRGVPVFCDKHLAYDRRHGRAMVEAAQQLKFPLMAGSSLPLTWRRPEVEWPSGEGVREALVASRGEIEVFGFHALEALQCMVERRAKRETGVQAVTCLEGDAVWRAGDAGVWSWDLLEHALGRSPSLNVGDVRDNCRQFLPPPGRPQFLRGPIAFVVEYRDGLRATALLLNGHVDDTTFAGRGANGEVRSMLFYLPPPPGASFLQALSSKVEEFLTTGRAPQPVERTLLTGGILDVALESRVQGHRRLETPDLAVEYEVPTASAFARGSETSPVGRAEHPGG